MDSIHAKQDRSTEEKISIIQEKLQAEYERFQADLRRNPDLFLESPDTAYAFKQAFDCLSENLENDNLPEELLDTLMGKDLILNQTYRKWNDLYINLVPAIEGDFIKDFSDSLTAEHNRSSIATLYAERAEIDHTTKKSINLCISRMDINQCNIYIDCLRLSDSLDPVYAADIAETLELFFSDDPAEILAKTKEIVDAQCRGFVATQAHCQENSSTANYEHKILIVDPTKLKSEYRRLENQLFLAQSGFGCSYTARGTSIFTENIYTGEKERWMRSDFLGIADVNQLPEEAQEAVHHYLQFHNSLTEETELEV